MTVFRMDRSTKLRELTLDAIAWLIGRALLIEVVTHDYPTPSPTDFIGVFPAARLDVETCESLIESFSIA